MGFSELVPQRRRRRRMNFPNYWHAALQALRTGPRSRRVTHIKEQRTLDYNRNGGIVEIVREPTDVGPKKRLIDTSRVAFVWEMQGSSLAAPARSSTLRLAPSSSIREYICRGRHCPVAQEQSSGGRTCRRTRWLRRSLFFAPGSAGAAVAISHCAGHWFRMFSVGGKH